MRRPGTKYESKSSHLDRQEGSLEGAVEEVGGVGQVPVLLVLLQVHPQLQPGSMLVLPDADQGGLHLVRSQSENSHQPAFPVVLRYF